MKPHEPHASQAMIVPTVPPRIPVLHAEDLPGSDDWALLTTLRVDRDDTFDHELQYDRYGSLMLAPAAFD
ncbi:MAG: hypothetical protein ABWY07_08000 [Burkholderiales bacterium]